MVDIEQPIHRGNQAFIDEDYPATLEVRYAVFSSEVPVSRWARLVRRSIS